MDVPFLKMHGCGNDFVVIDSRDRALDITPARAAAIADRRVGIGCDQVIVIERPVDGADAFMRIRNADGSEAGACGNATRCVAQLLGGRVVIETLGGALACETLGDGRVRVDMGLPRLGWADVPLAGPADTVSVPLGGGQATCCSMGNPHATFFVPDVGAIDLASLGPELEHAAIFPERANIGFAEVLAPDRLRLRVWERGAGITPACGSGACAAVVNAARRGLTGRQVTVIADGGELDIDWSGSVHMTGPATTVFRGTFALP